MRVFAWVRDNKVTVILGMCVVSLLTSTVVLAYRHKQLITCNHWVTEKPNMTGLEGDMVVKNIDYRLPRNVIPKHYKLMLQPDLKNKTFQGTVMITLDVLLPTSQIVLHSKNLDIGSVFMSTPTNKNIKATYENCGDDRNFLSVELGKIIQKGHPYILKIQFKGQLDKKIVGFYASTMKNGR